MDRTRLRKWLVGEFTLRRLARSIAQVIGLAYLGLCACGYFLTDRLIFHPRPSEGPGVGRPIAVRTPDGVTLSATYLADPEAEFTILYSHGNGETLADVTPILMDLRRAGFAVFSYDYRGYGRSGGSPSEASAYRDEETAYDYLTGELRVPPDRILAYGRSLGGAMAADLASRKPVGGLVLESAFISAFRVVTGIPLVPFDRFRNAEKLARVRCPVLVIHGREDEVIAFWHEETLHRLVKGPKASLWIDGAGHNDVSAIGGDRVREALTRFAATLDRVPKPPN